MYYISRVLHFGVDEEMAVELLLVGSERSSYYWLDCWLVLFLDYRVDLLLAQLDLHSQ